MLCELSIARHVFQTLNAGDVGRLILVYSCARTMPAHLSKTGCSEFLRLDALKYDIPTRKDNCQGGAASFARWIESA
jgi:hypothetical protein